MKEIQLLCKTNDVDNEGNSIEAIKLSCNKNSIKI